MTQTETPHGVIPYLLYEDADAAIDWLTKAFGFSELRRMTGEDGRANHVEMQAPDGGLVMFGAPGDGYRNPERLGARTHVQFAVVTDIEAHIERARDAGATIVDEVEEQFYGAKRYAADDLEGHRWYFNEYH